MRVGVGLSPNGLRACLTACSQTPFPASQPPPFSPSAILVLFPSAVAKAAAHIHVRASQPQRHSDSTILCDPDEFPSRVSVLSYYPSDLQVSTLLASRHRGRGAGSRWEGTEKDYW